MTSEGAVFKFSRACFNSLSFTAIQIQLLSKSSLKVLTCGSIILPFGASLSIGITRITVLFGGTRSVIISGELIKSSGRSFTSVFLKLKTKFSSFKIETTRILSVNFLIFSSISPDTGFMSVLLIIMQYGIFSSLNFSIRFSSKVSIPL